MNHFRSFWVLQLLLVVTSSAGEQWTRFRGPNGSGVDSSAGYPVEFSPSKNVLWKTSTPYGQSSPIVVGSRVFFTASEGDRLLTICVDSQNGRELWRREIRRERAAKSFHANDPASPTPAADEGGVYVFFPDFGLVSYSPGGKERWRVPLGPFDNFYGMAASPVVAGDLVVQVCDQLKGSFVIAVECATGRQRWKTERAGATIGWATPAVFRPAEGPPELILLGSSSLESFYLATGERHWWRPLASQGGLGVPAVHDDTILVSTLGSTEPLLPDFDSTLAQYDKDKDGRISAHEFADYPDMAEHFGWIDTNHDGFIDRQEWNAARSVGMGEYGAVAFRPGNAQGQLGAGAVVWRVQKNLPYIAAPLLYHDVYYMVRSGGIITSLNPASGELFKQGRTPEALGAYYASPVAADDKIFLASEEGKMTVLKAAPQWEVLSVNDLGDEIHATPALSEGRIFVRTHSYLYCFANSR